MLKPQYFLVVLVTFLSSCSSLEKNNTQYQSINSQQLTPLAAEFVTTSSRPEHSGITTEWRVLRNNERVELVYSDAHISEVWSKSSQDLWFYQKVFSEDKQVIEYSPSDLIALGVQPQWLPIALAIDPQVLKAIGNGKKGKPLFGFATQHFKGEFQGTQYDVIWLPELAIAARVKYSKEGISTLTEMKKPYQLAESPWKVTDTSRYRLIDFSDLGDMERDPFVIKVQSQLPGAHSHSH